jgi:hypothetical protein
VRKVALISVWVLLGLFVWWCVLVTRPLNLAPPEFVLGDSTCPRFHIPANLDPHMTPERTAAWFTVIYPSMTPNTDGSPRGQGAVTIWLTPYPKNGTAAEAILDGRFHGYELKDSTGDYKTFTFTFRKTGNVAVARLFRDSDGNAVSFEDPGNWSYSFLITGGNRVLGYGLRGSVSKKITDSPILVNQKLTALVRSMLATGPCVINGGARG